MTLDPLALRPGDILFVRGRGKDSAVTRVGQSVLRLFSSGRWTSVRYSHVMLGFSPGLVIHADGSAVRIERLAEALAGESIDGDRFRAVRFAAPPLDEKQATQLVAEAERFFKQRYSFILGRRSTPLGRLWHRQRALTLPFCSELVATAYAAIGIRVGDRPPDQTLPVDIDRHCVPPAWKDVSAEYAAAPLPQSFATEPIEVGGRVIPLQDFFRESDALVDRGAGDHAKVREHVHGTVQLQADIARKLYAASSINLKIALDLARAPLLFFRDHAELLRGDIDSLGDLYAQIRRGAPGATPSPVDAIQRLFPDADPDQELYEGLPSLNALRSLERRTAAYAFGARVFRAETALVGIATGLGILKRDDELFAGVTRAIVLPFLAQLPPLSEEESQRLRDRIDGLVIGEAGDYSRAVQRGCRCLVAVHALLSTARSGGTAGDPVGGRREN